MPATCQNIAAQFPNHGAIVFDDSECKVEDWDTPLALQNNEDKAWNLLSNPKVSKIIWTKKYNFIYIIHSLFSNRNMQFMLIPLKVYTSNADVA